eukprot:Skav219671  [mRNA]  locus=scaffold3149:23309:26664:+ [translate_table: standard]
MAEALVSEAASPTSEAAPEHTCKLCRRVLPGDSPGRLHGKQWTCRHCLSLQQLLLRNLGPEDQQGFSTEGRIDFFRRAASTPQTGAYTWESVRSMILDVQTASHKKEQRTKVKGESLPLSVWVARGYEPEVVKQYPSEEDPTAGTLYTVPVHSVNMIDSRTLVTEQILQKEQAAKKAAKKRGASPQEDNCEDWDIVASAGAASTAAPKKVKTEAGAEKGSAKAEKTLEKERVKQEKLNSSQAALSSKATAGLTRALQSANSLLSQAEKTKCSAEDVGPLKEAVGKAEAWNKACVDCLAQVGLVKGSGAKLDPLPFESKDLPDFLKAVSATCKDLRAVVQAKKATQTAAKKKGQGKLQGSEMIAVGRKRKLSVEEETNFQECLNIPGVSDEVVRRIWNHASRLRTAAETISTGQRKKLVQEHLRDVARVYVPWHVPDTDQTIYMPCLDTLLQCVAQLSPTWTQLLNRVHSSTGGVLRPVLYHDDITCGNILAVIKVKKITCVYLSFLELHAHVHKEAAWLPLLCIQRVQTETIPGGLSAIIAELVKRIHRFSIEAFTVLLHGQAKQFLFFEQSLFVADQEAQRDTWLSKGSSGLKPCQFCSNVVSKRALSSEQPDFYTLASAAWEHFVPIPDAQVNAAYARLSGLRTKKERDQWEKAHGLTWDPRTLLADSEASARLPLSAACNDHLHAYFLRGVAAIEIFLLVSLLETHGVTREDILRAALRAGVQRTGKSENQTERLISRLLHEKQFDSTCYRGEVEETREVVFLLLPVFCDIVPKTADLQPAMLSFIALYKTCRELRRLKYSWQSLTEEAHVADLRFLQLKHQLLFVQAYTEQAVVPKHHHRLHLPDGALKLGFLPNCETHESKHRVLKGGGLVDRQKGKLFDHEQLQKSLLPRLLQVTINQANSFGLGQWCLSGTISSASQEWKVCLRDGTLTTSNSATLRQVSVSTKEPLLINGRAFSLLLCLRGKDAGLWLQLAPLTFLREHVWGTDWKTNEEHFQLYKPKTHHEINVPVWWRFSENRFTLIY